MAKQFSILATDVDLKVIEALLREMNITDVLSDVPTENFKDLQPLEDLAIPVGRAGALSPWCYLAPRNSGRVISLERQGPLKVDVDIRRSNLIEFMRPFFNGKIVRRGRMYFENKSYIDDSWKEKDPEVCSWADKVMTRVRKSLKYDRHRSAYVGENALQLIEQGIVVSQ